MVDVNHLLSLKDTAPRHIALSNNSLFNFRELVNFHIWLTCILSISVLNVSKPLGVFKNYEYLKKSNKTLFLMKQTPSNLITDIDGWVALFQDPKFQEFSAIKSRK